MDNSKYKTHITVFLLIAFSFSLRFLGINKNLTPYHGDSCAYMALAESVFTEKPFFTSVNCDIYTQRPNVNTEHPDDNYPPLFTLGLAFIYRIFGFSLFYSGYAASLFDALSIIPVFLIAKALFDRRAGLAAGLFAALNFQLWESSRMGLSEPLYVFLGLWVIYLLIRYFLHDGLGNVILAGVLCGLAYLVRSQGLLIGLFLAAAILFKKERLRLKAAAAALFMCFFFIAALPWLIRNYVCFKQPFFNFAGALAFVKEGGPSLGAQSYSLNLLDYLRHNSVMEILKSKLTNLFILLSFITRETFILFPFALFYIFTRSVKNNRPLVVIYAALLANLGVIALNIVGRYLVLSYILLIILAAAAILAQSDECGKPRFTRFIIVFCAVYFFAGFIPKYVTLYDLEYPFAVKFEDRLFLSDVGAWLKANTPPDARIMTSNPSALNLYSGRATFVTLGVNDTISDPDSAARTEEVIEKYKIDYFVDSSPEGRTPRGFILAHTFEKPVYIGDNPFIFRVFKKGRP